MKTIFFESCFECETWIHNFKNEKAPCQNNIESNVFQVILRLGTCSNHTALKTLPHTIIIISNDTNLWFDDAFDRKIRRFFHCLHFTSFSPLKTVSHFLHFTRVAKIENRSRLNRSSNLNAAFRFQILSHRWLLFNLKCKHQIASRHAFIWVSSIGGTPLDWSIEMCMRCVIWHVKCDSRTKIDMLVRIFLFHIICGAIHSNFISWFFLFTIVMNHKWNIEKISNPRKCVGKIKWIRSIYHGYNEIELKLPHEKVFFWLFRHYVTLNWHLNALSAYVNFSILSNW